MPTNEQAVAVLAHRTAQEQKAHPEHTKIGRILGILRSGRSLNRFEAERFGDHCLHSTVARLNAEGFQIVGRWEEVPCRFAKTTRVKRYHYVGGRHE